MEPIAHSASSVRVADLRRVREVVARNHVGRGPLTQQLQQALASTFDRAAAVVADSGESALALALAHLHRARPRADEVVVCAYVCPAVVNAILGQGLRPVFADAMPGALNLDLSDVARRWLSERTLAVICTHVGGMPDDLQAALALPVPVISDCAQAIGASFGGRPVLALGRMAVASFGATKYITAGLGGALLADAGDAEAIATLARPELAVADYRAGGFVRTLGQHFGDFNAALALAQLERLESFRAARLAIAQRYDQVLREVRGVALPEAVAGGERNGFRYYFLSEDASAWLERLQAAGIDARNSIAHVMTDYFPGSGPHPMLDHLARRVVSLPIHPALTRAQCDRVVRTLRAGAP